MNARSDANPPTRHTRQSVLHGSNGSWRSRERDEERVAVRADLHAAVASKRIAQNAAVPPKLSGIPLGAKLLEQPGRPLHIGEEESDGANRQIARHVDHGSGRHGRGISRAAIAGGTPAGAEGAVKNRGAAPGRRMEPSPG
jgi:hypothetical protein